MVHYVDFDINGGAEQSVRLVVFIVKHGQPQG